MSNLPFLKIAKTKIELPDSKRTIEIRPYLAGEEKALLMAIESKDPETMQNAVRNLITECIITKDVTIDNLSMMDLEFIFIKLRTISVDRMVTINLPHENLEECDHLQKVELDLENMRISNTLNKKIMIDDDIGVMMKTPTIKIVEDLSGKTNVEKTFNMIVSCVDYVFDKETVYKDFTREEMKAWIDQLTEKQIEKLLEFFETIPKIVYDVAWTCEKCGKKEQREYEGLLNFL